MSRTSKLRSLRHHTPSGRDVVTIDGQDFCCGPWGPQVAKQEYDRIVAEWLAHGRSLRRPGVSCPDLTVTELVNRYHKFALGHYQRDGQPTREVEKIRDALRPV